MTVRLLSFVCVAALLSACGASTADEEPMAFEDVQDLLSRGEDGWEDQDYSEHCNDLDGWIDELWTEYSDCVEEEADLPDDRGDGAHDPNNQGGRYRDGNNGVRDEDCDTDNGTDRPTNPDPDTDVYPCDDIRETLGRAILAHERDCLVDDTDTELDSDTDGRGNPGGRDDGRGDGDNNQGGGRDDGGSDDGGRGDDDGGSGGQDGDNEQDTDRNNQGNPGGSRGR